MFCRSLFVLLYYFFGYCIVCSSIYGFWLPFRYLQTHLLHFISYAYISRAWLKSDEDIVIERLQNRIKAATGLDLESADDLQVSILVLFCDVQIRLSVKSSLELMLLLYIPDLKYNFLCLYFCTFFSPFYLQYTTMLKRKS